MSKIQVELPDTIAQAAQAANYLLTVANEVAAAGVMPMTMDEINAEVKAVRRERRQHADRR